jgi:hypothetical protein
MNVTTFEVPKDLDTPQTIACKRIEIDEKLNKKRKRRHDNYFKLALAFSQIVKFSNKIETMKMDM